MMWLEVIHLRVTDQDFERLMPTFTQLLDEIREKESCRKVKLFRRALLATDVCLHLYHNSHDADNGGSPVGLRLVDALKPLGMVYHTVWAQIEEGTT
ncbi:MAG: hypothetical protein EX260_04525 [Desulfobulbaceae bacterium]|nr:MAG: hypothetical protein EX260_04525 [Desulfobulbaceae bacterium]